MQSKFVTAYLDQKIFTEGLQLESGLGIAGIPHEYLRPLHTAEQ
jgi:hypothetical protein